MRGTSVFCVFSVMNFLKSRWFLLGLRIIVGSVFLYAGILKLANPQAFADSIATFQMLPVVGIGILALTLPPFEILAGLLLINGWQLRSASFAVAVLCIVFAGALAQALARGLQIDCGCFGSREPSPFNTWLSLGRNILLFSGTITIYLTNRGKRSLL